MQRLCLAFVLLSACGGPESSKAEPAPAKAAAPAPAPEPEPTAPETAPADDGAGIAVGDVAPPFTLPDDSGKDISLDQYRDQRAVLLAFYPKDFTGG